MRRRKTARGLNLGVLVTGAGGFIGSHVVRRLLAEGEEVHALLRDEAKAERLAGLGTLRRWTGDLGDSVALEKCLKGARPERIFHCAGVSRARHMSGWEPVREAQRVNVDGLVNLLEAVSISGAPGHAGRQHRVFRQGSRHAPAARGVPVEPAA